MLVEETRVPRESHRPVTSHWQTLSHNVVPSTPCLCGIRTHNVSGDSHWIGEKTIYYVKWSAPKQMFNSVMTRTNYFIESWCFRCIWPTHCGGCRKIIWWKNWKIKLMF
jgi:hypothetical protein